MFIRDVLWKQYNIFNSKLIFQLYVFKELKNKCPRSGVIALNLCASHWGGLLVCVLFLWLGSGIFLYEPRKVV